MVTEGDIQILDTSLAVIIAAQANSKTASRINRFVSNFKTSLDNLNKSRHRLIVNNMIGIYTNIALTNVQTTDWPKDAKSILSSLINSYSEYRKI